MTEHFSKPFTQQEPIPEAGIERAVELLRSGRLHRYNVVAGETAEATLLEEEYAAYQGAKFCLAVTTGTCQVPIKSSPSLIGMEWLTPMSADLA